MIAPIRAPIRKYGDISIFLQPYALMGYVHIPILDPLWPEASISPKDNLEFNAEINNPGSMTNLLKTLVDAANWERELLKREKKGEKSIIIIKIYLLNFHFGWYKNKKKKTESTELFGKGGI